jgi:hypothetical protein
LSAVFPGLSGGEFRRAGITGEKGSEAIFLLIQKTEFTESIALNFPVQRYDPSHEINFPDSTFNH